MIARLKALFRTPEPAPFFFTGLGVVLVSDLCSVSLKAETLGPTELIHAISESLTFQTDTIRHCGGIIDKYVGGAVIAYWPPHLMPGAVVSAKLAACALMTKQGIGKTDLNFDLVVSFSASEFSVAMFGPPTAFRIQAVGRALSRAQTMLKRLRTRGVITDEETLAMLPPKHRAAFVLQDGHACITA